MSAKGRNEEIRILDDFLSEAVHEASSAPPVIAQQGQNEGIRILKELVVDLETPSVNQQ